MDFPWIMELKTWLKAVVGQVRVVITLPHIKRQGLFVEYNDMPYVTRQREQTYSSELQAIKISEVPLPRVVSPVLSLEKENKIPHISTKIPSPHQASPKNL